MSELPDITGVTELGLDVETDDPNLKQLGPGAKRDGELLGVSVAWGQERLYVPLNHASGNLPHEVAIPWLKRTLSLPCKKIGHNLFYDLSYLFANDLPVEGPFEDTFINERLLTDDLPCDLGSTGTRHVGLGKSEDRLNELAAQLGVTDIKGSLKQLPGEDVAEYAADDAWLPLQVAPYQRERLDREELLPVQRLESKLLPILVKMHLRGVRVDEQKLEQAEENLNRRYRDLQRELKRQYGREVDVWTAEDIAKVFDQEGLPYMRTPKANLPSFTREFLENHQHPLPQLIWQARQVDKIRGTFLDGQIKAHLTNGRIHSTVNQMGARGGRMSSSHPNQQFFPSRDEVLAPLIRGLFVPDPGRTWCRGDYSQIEFRLFVHYARGPGAAAVVKEYQEQPETDYHAFVCAISGLERKPAKNLNFGLLYGQGFNKTCAVLNRPKDEVRALLNTYHEKLPFMKQTFNAAMNAANAQGFVRTIMGRKKRYEKWEAKKWAEKGETVLSQIEAAERWPSGHQRAFTYSALNGTLQGSAAEIMKLAMVNAEEAGIFQELDYPLFTVHDELDVDAELERVSQKDAVAELKHQMESAYKLRVPVLVDFEFGPNWGSLEEIPL